VSHQAHEIADHVLAHLGHQLEALGGDVHKDLAAVRFADLAPGVTKAFQAIYEPCRGGGGVPHPLGNLSHGERKFLLGEKSEEKILGERHVTARKFLGEVENKTALHDRKHIGQLFRVRTHFGFVASVHAES
jgi:hypothetical protein